MKKILSLVLAIFTLMLCFVGCDSLKHEHITGEWECNESGHWQPITCNLNTCNLEEIPILDHIDDNDDNICDICGYPKMLSTEQPTDSKLSDNGLEPEPEPPLDSNNTQSGDNADYVTIGTAVSDVMPPYAISCKIPTEYSTDNTNIPIILSFGLVEGCDADTDNYSEIVLSAENDEGKTIIIKRINISEILKRKLQ